MQLGAVHWDHVLAATLAHVREQRDTTLMEELANTLDEQRAHMKSTPTMTALFRSVSFSFNDFTPNMIPLHQGQQHGAAVWGLTVEQDAAFLRNGCYSVSAVGEHPEAAVCSCTHEMDFITMSRCMVPEGSELWIHLATTPPPKNS